MATKLKFTDALLVALVALAATACEALKATSDKPITSARIENGAVSSEDLAEDAVTASSIADNSIGNAQLANSAITSSKISDGTIVGADLSSTAALSVASVTTTGAVVAGSTVTGATGLRATTGGLIVSLGGATITGNSTVTGTLTASSTLTASNGLAVTLGGAAITGLSTLTHNGAGVSALTITNTAAGTGLTIADGGLAVTSDGITVAAGGANITGGLTADSIAYSAAQSRTLFVDPTTCRVDSNNAAGNIDRIANDFTTFDNIGPGIRMADITLTEINLICPVQIPVSASATVSITGHTAHSFDPGSKCSVGAKLQSKTLGANAAATDAHAYICSGAESAACSTDYVAVNAAPQSQTDIAAGVAFTAIDASSTSTMVWVRVLLTTDTTCLATDYDTPGDACDCRYLGSIINYTTTRP